MSLLFGGDGVYAWSYYDGYVFGEYQDQGVKHWFMITDESNADMGSDDARMYHAWVIDEFLDTRDDMINPPEGWQSPNGWLQPTRPPDKTVSEDFLIALYAREED